MSNFWTNRLNILSSRPAGDSIAQFLEPQALERLSRVSLVRPDRAQAVEGYLQQLISRGQVSRKISEQEIVDILNGIARDQNRKNDTRIIFDRRETVENSVSMDEESEDDFFDWSHHVCPFWFACGTSYRIW